jgi:malate dehydrogenase (oxaloacetate-decarboxylating)(NADP+)
MFLAAAKTLAGLVREENLVAGLIYPSLRRIREVSAHIATAVAEVAYEQNLATLPRPKNLLAFVQSQMYQPVYRDYAVELA